VKYTAPLDNEVFVHSKRGFVESIQTDGINIRLANRRVAFIEHTRIESIVRVNEYEHIEFTNTLIEVEYMSVVAEISSELAILHKHIPAKFNKSPAEFAKDIGDKINHFFLANDS
jgi:hypothetical protein